MSSIGEVLPTSIRDEMEQSYLAYSMSVIIGRALPDVRDGLKPVHRRVLHAMNEQSNTHARPYKKSARIVGDVIGKYHPHGDSAVYDTIVRMAQDFSLRYPLVDGQGNFGSVDGDPPAAMRYTEVRMQRITQALLNDIDKDTVDFIPNYDGQDTEPTVLPTRLPNLLVNGSSGIAVGMATNIPPHHLGEVIEAVIRCIEHPETSVEDLLDVVKGPDFPTAGLIMGVSGIREAYRNGRGRVVMRARTEIEENEKTGRQAIIVRELPYQVNKAALVEKIAELVRDKKMTGISDLRDESDRDGMRIVIEIKKNEVAQVVLNNLFKHTSLQTSFGVNMVAIVDGQPRTLNLLDCIRHFIEFRRDVVTRRTRFELAEAEKRAHILEGLKIALDHLDEVIKLIRSSDSPQAAKEGLRLKFKLSDVQAQAVLDMRLQKLTSLERDKIVEEYEEVLRLVAKLEEILANPKLVDQIVIDESKQLLEEHGDTRRTEIRPDESEFDKAELIADEEMVITVSHRGYIKRSPLTEYRAQKRGGKGRTGMTTRDEDFVEHVFVATAHDSLLVFTEQGKVHALPVWDIPQVGIAAKGQNIANLLMLPSDDKLKSMQAVRRDWLKEDGRFLIFATKRGYVKRMALNALANIRQGGIIATAIMEDDELIGVRLTEGNAHVIMATRQGQSVRFEEENARAMGRTARGVIGIRLKADDELVDMTCFEGEEGMVLTLSEQGYGKRTAVAEYRVQNRGGSGIRNFNVTDKTGLVAGVKFVIPGQQLVVMSEQGKVLRAEVDEIRETGRAAQGVRTLTVDGGDRIAGMALIDERDETEDEEQGPDETGPDSDNKPESTESDEE
ncbi:MAG: DNA gyrase subunit A [Acidobacteriota bacterium]